MMLVPCIVVITLFLNTVKSDWMKIWEDEFNGGNLEDRWNFEMGCSGFGNNELQCYTQNREENIQQINGRLIITALHEWWGDGKNADKEFTSSRITSKVSWRFGKFEIRAKLPKGKHLWPAIWMLPTHLEYGEWPQSGEIDIMEYRGQRTNQISGNLHFGQEWNNMGHIGTGDKNFPFEFSTEYHTFGFDWSPSLVQWMVDDQIYHWESLEKKFWTNYKDAGQPFDKNFSLLLNLAVGGFFFGDESFNAQESRDWEKNTFEIEWVRVFKWV